MAATVSFNRMVELRETFDQLLHDAASIGGSVAETIETFLLQLHAAWLDSIERAFATNPEGLQQLRKAEWTRARYQKFRNRFLAQAHRLPADDVVPALLSEDADTIRTAFAVLREHNPERAQQLALSAFSLLRQVVNAGAEVPDLEAKLMALGLEPRDVQ